MLQLRPPLTPAVPAPPCAARALKRRATPPPEAPPPPRAPPREARDTPRAGGAVPSAPSRLAAPPQLGWRNPERPGGRLLLRGLYAGSFPDLPETADSSVIRPPAPAPLARVLGRTGSEQGTFSAIPAPFAPSRGPAGPQARGRPAASTPHPEPLQLAPPGGLKVSGVARGSTNWVEFIQMKTSFLVVQLSFGLPLSAFSPSSVYSRIRTAKVVVSLEVTLVQSGGELVL